MRPEIDDTSALLAEGARHPVVEEGVRREGQGFTPNDARLDADGKSGPRLLVVTGPNMAGKSTYLRQIALLSPSSRKVARTYRRASFASAQSIACSRVSARPMISPAAAPRS